MSSDDAFNFDNMSQGDLAKAAVKSDPKVGVVKAVVQGAPDDVEYEWTLSEADKQKLRAQEPSVLLAAYLRASRVSPRVVQMFSVLTGLKWADVLAICAIVTSFGQVVAKTETLPALDVENPEVVAFADAYTPADFINAMKEMSGAAVTHVSPIMLEDDLMTGAQFTPLTVDCADGLYTFEYRVGEYKVHSSDFESDVSASLTHEDILSMSRIMGRRYVLHHYPANAVDAVASAVTISGSGEGMLFQPVSYSPPPSGLPLVPDTIQRGVYSVTEVHKLRTRIKAMMDTYYPLAVREKNPKRAPEPPSLQLKLLWALSIISEKEAREAKIDSLVVHMFKRGTHLWNHAKWSHYADMLSLLSVADPLPLCTVLNITIKALDPASRVQMFLHNASSGKHHGIEGYYPNPADALRYLADHRRFRNDTGDGSHKANMFRHITQTMRIEGCTSRMRTMAKMAPAVAWFRKKLEALKVEALAPVSVYGVGQKGHFIPLFHGLNVSFYDINKYPSDVHGYMVTNRDIMQIHQYVSPAEPHYLFSDVFVEHQGEDKPAKKDTAAYQRYTYQEQMMLRVLETEPRVAVIKGFLPDLHYKQNEHTSEDSYKRWAWILARYTVATTPGGSYHSGEIYYCFERRYDPKTGYITVAVSPGMWMTFHAQIARFSVAVCAANDVRSGFLAAGALPTSDLEFWTRFGSHLPKHIVEPTEALQRMMSSWNEHVAARGRGVKPGVAPGAGNFTFSAETVPDFDITG